MVGTGVSFRASCGMSAGVVGIDDAQEQLATAAHLVREY